MSTSRTIRLEVENDGEWITVAERHIDEPQQGNSFKNIMENAVRPLRVVQEVNP